MKTIKEICKHRTENFCRGYDEGCECQSWPKEELEILRNTHELGCWSAANSDTDHPKCNCWHNDHVSCWDDGEPNADCTCCMDLLRALK